MNKFRASYTVMDKWVKGDWQGAIKTYFKMDQFVTRAMVEGRELHKQWEAHIKETKTSPAVFGGKKLKNPIAEGKKVIELQPWLDLVYIPDCIDSPTLHEFKSGKQSSMHYANDWQVAIYAVGATLSGHYIKVAEIHHYDQYTKKSDMSLVWITDKLLNNTYNKILTVAGEMHDYFEKNELYGRFNHLLVQHG